MRASRRTQTVVAAYRAVRDGGVIDTVDFRAQLPAALPYPKLIAAPPDAARAGRTA